MNGQVAIIGAGVAGCATALMLRHLGRSATVIERSGRGATAARVGEHLSPDVRPSLARLGLWELFLAAGHLPCAGIRASWGDADLHERAYLSDAYGPGWNLDRRRFEAMLADAAEAAGAALLRGARMRSVERGAAAGWRLVVDEAGRERRLEADVLVDATGRAAAIARRLGGQRIVYDELIGLVRWLPAGGATGSSDGALLVEAAEDGWWYAARLPGSRLVAVFLTDRVTAAQAGVRPDRLWLARVRRTRHVRGLMERPGGTAGATAVRAANSFRLDSASGPGWLAVGDAAAAVDPLSSGGIARALGAGIAAARAIDRHLAGEADALQEYEVDVAAEFDTYLVERTATYRQETRWPESDFWRRRHARVVALERIFLDPLTALQAVEADVRNLAGARSGLAPSDVTRLCALCHEPTPAHRVVRAFKDAANRPISERRVIVALQSLITNGVLRDRGALIEASR
jgi:flavin-dependent dehydrogenase